MSQVDETLKSSNRNRDLEGCRGCVFYVLGEVSNPLFYEAFKKYHCEKGILLYHDKCNSRVKNNT